MNKLVSKIAITVSAVAALLFPVLSPALAGAVAVPNNIATQACIGTTLNVSDSGASCTGDNTNNTLQSITTTVVNLLSLVVGLISVIFLIFGAFKYITSGGDSGKVTSAKNTILYALIGLVIVSIAQVVVRVVLGKAGTIV